MNVKLHLGVLLLLLAVNVHGQVNVEEFDDVLNQIDQDDGDLEAEEFAESGHENDPATFRLAISTWNFGSATEKAWKALESGLSAIDAVEQGCTVCEEFQCDGTVGFGGSPAENGETALDAMIMDGRTCNVGAVASLRRIKPAISVARKVLENTRHSILAGDLATEFAVQMGFKEETLSTEETEKMWKDWKDNKCQPNFWMNVLPDPSTSCGPYKPSAFSGDVITSGSGFGGSGNHDTIGMVAIDAAGNVASGTSTNGARFKISGRVGDSPIPGAGSYADNKVGGAAATGDGDVMLRFLPSYQAVESMRRGLSPSLATKDAMERIVEHHPDFMGAVLAVNMEGEIGASCHGLAEFPFTVASSGTSGQVVQLNVTCI